MFHAKPWIWTGAAAAVLLLILTLAVPLFVPATLRLQNRLSFNLFRSEVTPGNGRIPVLWMDYKVQPGENIWDLSRKTGLRVDTILSCNALDKPNALAAGKLLRLPHVDGILVRVAADTDLSNLAKERETSLDAIRWYNGLTADRTPTNGSKLFLPGARLSADERMALIGTELYCPMQSGTFRVTGGYGWRFHPILRTREFHQGIDLGAGVGTTVYAAQAGTVTFAAFDFGYGMFIAIQHKNHLMSRYAHLSRLYVHAGQNVNAGQAIGAVGMTGRTTGPHLHFETMRDGRWIDPREVTVLR